MESLFSRRWTRHLPPPRCLLRSPSFSCAPSSSLRLLFPAHPCLSAVLSSFGKMMRKFSLEEISGQNIAKSSVQRAVRAQVWRAGAFLSSSAPFRLPSALLRNVHVMYTSLHRHVQMCLMCLPEHAYLRTSRSDWGASRGGLVAPLIRIFPLPSASQEPSQRKFLSSSVRERAPVNADACMRVCVAVFLLC